MKSYFTKQNWELKGFWLSDYLKKCKDWFYEINIKKQYKQRSLEQNSYLWGVCYKMLSEHLWYELDEVHDVMCEKFLRQTYKIKGGIELHRNRSTTELTTEEFNKYIDDIRLFSQKFLSLYIPLPNESII